MLRVSRRMFTFSPSSLSCTPFTVLRPWIPNSSDSRAIDFSLLPSRLSLVLFLASSSSVLSFLAVRFMRYLDFIMTTWRTLLFLRKRFAIVSTFIPFVGYFFFFPFSFLCVLFLLFRTIYTSTLGQTFDAMG